MPDNTELVRRGYDAFNTGDIETLTALFDGTASWHTPGRSGFAGDHVGRDEILRYFGRLAQDTGGTFRASLLHLTADQDSRVVAVQRCTGTRNSKQLDVDCCLVF